jgi:hypothetical protein
MAGNKRPLETDESLASTDDVPRETKRSRSSSPTVGGDAASHTAISTPSEFSESLPQGYKVTKDSTDNNSHLGESGYPGVEARNDQVAGVQAQATEIEPSTSDARTINRRSHSTSPKRRASEQLEAADGDSTRDAKRQRRAAAEAANRALKHPEAAIPYIAATKEEKAEWKGFCEIESDPVSHQALEDAAY